MVDGILEAGSTVLVPAFSHQFGVAPPDDDRPRQNAFDYAQPRDSPGLGRVFRPDADVEPWLGAVPAYVVTRPELVRSGNPGGFGALGPMATDLIVDDPRDVFGPLRALVRCRTCSSPCRG